MLFYIKYLGLVRIRLSGATTLLNPDRLERKVAMYRILRSCFVLLLLMTASSSCTTRGVVPQDGAMTCGEVEEKYAIWTEHRAEHAEKMKACERTLMCPNPAPPIPVSLNRLKDSCSHAHTCFPEIAGDLPRGRSDDSMLECHNAIAAHFRDNHLALP